ncbi:hypothetical protein HYFRA_00002805 [Hymenoscyphus fraxineus]|uniref:DNA polymerase epsilon subunit D n=1 Tax=Hymenoscyphus fraxineus TaxID=746836 RepID=A0A9N9KP82_9HELO|nr:hypothetical protein HYFRA_00002805 [Hymenoscyphus fraxineus]
MPPKKAMPTMAPNDEAALAKEQSVRDGINIDDFALPKSIVTKLAKGVLPPNTQIQGNAMLAMTKSATVFVNYLASHANEHAISRNQKTLSAADVFAALEELEFPDWKEKLEGELAKWHEIQADKKNASKKKAAEKGEDGEVDTQGENEDAIKSGPPAAKKARLDSSQRPGGGVEKSGLPARPNTGEGTADEDAGDEEDPAEEEEEDEEDEEAEERIETEEQPDDTQAVEAEDEALDNGEDSD